jgi:geranylgeranyl diphosphate synthase type II
MAEQIPTRVQSDREIPTSGAVRRALREHASTYALKRELVPPLSLDELRRHAEVVLGELALPPALGDFATVLLGNAVWAPVVAGIPFARRVLLLPQCLRTRSTCPATLDELGLLCEQCGGCPTGGLVEEAEELGYVVLVAEGTTVVTRLLQAGTIDAVVGVGCLEALERSFPFATASAVPSIGVPLLRAGCDATQVDLEWLREAIHLEAPDPGPQLVAIEDLRFEVSSWFETASLTPLLDLQGTQTERVAVDWMATGGKRWRPVLAVAVWQALSGRSISSSATLRRIAVAVECFHKASLVHDDIEDGDAERYGEPTLHRQVGLPIALNAGDLLIGEGYRLLASLDLDDAIKGTMLRVAARAHRDLCLGQGEELAWTRNPSPLSVRKVLDIFRLKTAPAFEVALSLGALSGGGDEALCELLQRFSSALGAAYQIRDDIEDFNRPDGDIVARRPSLLLALAMEQADGEIGQQIAQSLTGNGDPTLIRDTIASLGLEAQAWGIFEATKEQALGSLEELRHQPLKSLLYRLVHKVLGSATPPPGARHQVNADILSFDPARRTVPRG